MIFHWIMFIPALLVLFYPLARFMPKAFSLRQLNYIDFSKPGMSKRAPWSIPALWSDGARSFLGAFLLINAWGVEPSEGWMRHAPLVISFSILLLSVVVQMYTRKSDDRFLAPVTYVAGIWLALVPLPVALVAAAVGGVCMVAFRSLSAFFAWGAATVVAFGFAVLHAGIWSLVAAMVGVTPWVVSWMCRRPLAVPLRMEVVKVIKQRSRDVSVGAGLRLSEKDKVEV